MDADRQPLIQFLTTEHFTLQGARSSAITETNSRLQLYMAVLSSAILAMALVAQASSLGTPFYAFAFVLLPMVYGFGLATIGRLRQAWAEWFFAGQGMARIRRFFVEEAPEAARYLTLPTTDEPMATLGGAGIRVGGPLRGLVTAFGVIAMVNSVVGGAFAGLLATRLGGNRVATAIAGGVVAIASVVLLMRWVRRGFQGQVATAEVRFPPSA